MAEQELDNIVKPDMNEITQTRDYINDVRTRQGVAAIGELILSRLLFEFGSELSEGARIFYQKYESGLLDHLPLLHDNALNIAATLEFFVPVAIYCIATATVAKGMYDLYHAQNLSDDLLRSHMWSKK